MSQTIHIREVGGKGRRPAPAKQRGGGQRERIVEAPERDR